MPSTTGTLEIEYEVFFEDTDQYGRYPTTVLIHTMVPKAVEGVIKQMALDQWEARRG